MTRLFIRAALLAVFVIGAIESAWADLSISKKPTHDVTCSGGVCTATAKGANLNVNDLTNLLAAGDTTVKFGGGALAIQVLDGFSWTNASRLTLDANTSVGFHKPVTVAGQGAVTITYNNGGSSGDLKFFDKGRIDFWDLNSSLRINGKSYTLAADVKTLGNGMSGNRSGAFALANDYDAAKDGSYKTAVVSDGFGGTLEGLGHQIANFKLTNCEQGSGFIDEITDKSALVENIRFVDANVVSCKANSLGVVAGFSYGTVRDVAVSGTITISEDTRDFNSFDVGGVLGETAGLIENSSAEVSIGCRKLGCKIDQQDYGAVGGLVGRTSKGGVVLRSRSSGSINGWSNFIYAGGLVGIADELVSQSFSTANVAIHGGALYGSSGGLAASAKDVEDCYALGADDSKKGATVGGLIGEVRDGGSIARAYSTGALTAPDGAFLGGFVGRDLQAGDLSFAYWDLDTSNVSDPGQGAGNIPDDPGITGLTDVQLRSGLPAGFDPKIWGQSPNINNGYPYLLANPPPN